MTKRKMQHQLEDLSRHKFGLALPGRWVIRDKDKDYGIDGEVEIFDSKGKATGLVFWVQLKATGSKQDRIIKGIDLRLETIRYYKSLDIPVLIARYSEDQDTFYIKWAKEIDPFYAKIGAKTMRVSFSESDLLNDDKINDIEQHLSKLRAITSGALRLPIGISLSFGSQKICGTSSDVLLTKIRSNLKNFQNILRFETNKEYLSANIFIDKSTMKIGILGIAGCTFHSVDLMEKATLPIDLIKDISLGISIALSQLGYSDLAARIIFSYDIHNRLKMKPEIILSLLPDLLKTSYFRDTLDLVSDVCDEEDNNFLEIAASSALLFIRGFKQEGKFEVIEAFLKRNAERWKTSEPKLYGVAQYNLGNFYRNTNRLKDSIKCYLIARRYEPNYYNQEYFWGELAGALFDYGKYRNAAHIYKKALDFKGNREWRPQYADSLMFAGEYQKALELFEEYLSETKDQTAEWHLKSICLSTLIENYKIKSQFRKIKPALHCAGVVTGTEKEKVDRFERALEQDLLCGLAWYNLGQSRFEEGEIEGASFCFTVCSLVQRWDIEAWVNATVSSFNKTVPTQFFVLLVRAGYFYNGDEYIEALYRLIENQSGEEGLSLLASVVEQLISAERKETIKPELRMMNKEGKFEDIFEVVDPTSQ